MFSDYKNTLIMSHKLYILPNLIYSKDIFKSRYYVKSTSMIKERKTNEIFPRESRKPTGRGSILQLLELHFNRVLC